MHLNNNYYYFFNKEVFILMLLAFRLWVNAHFAKKAIDVKRAAQTLDANNKATDWREMRLFALTDLVYDSVNRVNDTIIIIFQLQNSSGCDPTLD